jgi:hypothetical protein
MIIIWLGATVKAAPVIPGYPGHGILDFHPDTGRGRRLLLGG